MSLRIACPNRRKLSDNPLRPPRQLPQMPLRVAKLLVRIDVEPTRHTRCLGCGDRNTTALTPNDHVRVETPQGVILGLGPRMTPVGHTDPYFATRSFCSVFMQSRKKIAGKT